MADSPNDVPVYSRDRSWYQSRPNTTRVPKLHRESRNDPGMAACEPFTLMLDENTKAWASEAEGRLCRRCFRPADEAGTR